jgi:hypothetical protein
MQDQNLLPLHKISFKDAQELATTAKFFLDDNANLALATKFFDGALTAAETFTLFVSGDFVDLNLNAQEKRAYTIFAKKVSDSLNSQPTQRELNTTLNQTFTESQNDSKVYQVHNTLIKIPRNEVPQWDGKSQSLMEFMDKFSLAVQKICINGVGWYVLFGKAVNEQTYKDISTALLNKEGTNYFNPDDPFQLCKDKLIRLLAPALYVGELNLMLQTSYIVQNLDTPYTYFNRIHYAANALADLTKASVDNALLVMTVVSHLPRYFQDIYHKKDPSKVTTLQELQKIFEAEISGFKETTIISRLQDKESIFTKSNLKINSSTNLDQSSSSCSWCKSNQCFGNNKCTRYKINSSSTKIFIQFAQKQYKKRNGVKRKRDKLTHKPKQQQIS